MASLTPIGRAGEVSGEAMKEGLITGGLTLIPAYGALQLALKNVNFRSVGDWSDSSLFCLATTDEPSFRSSSFIDFHLLLHRSLPTVHELAEPHSVGHHAGPVHVRLVG